MTYTQLWPRARWSGREARRGGLNLIGQRNQPRRGGIGVNGVCQNETEVAPAILPIVILDQH